MSPTKEPEKLLLPLSEQCRPIFILGMNGSGTSMLADCLGQHPGLFSTHFETKMIPYFIHKMESYGDLTADNNFHKLWEDVLDMAVFRRMNKGKLLPLPECWRDYPRNLEAVIDAGFRMVALKFDKQRWAEKTPQNVQHLNSLSECFPGAKFIHIVRDGRDCAASFHRRWQRNPKNTIFRWKKVVQEGSSQGAMLEDKYLQLRYEDLTENPEFWMREICEFVDLSFDKAVLKSNQPHMHNKDAPGVIYPNSEKWRTYFSEKEIKNLECIAGKCLHCYGYAAVMKHGDKDPNVMQRLLWRWSDAVRQGSGLVIKKLTGQGNKMAWSRLLKYVVTSLKQSKTNKY